MSIKQRILDWFRNNPDTTTDSAQLCERLGTEERQQVQVALNALHNEVGLKREPKQEGRGLDYWLPKSAVADLPPAKNGPLDPKAVAGRLAADRQAKTPKPAKKRAARKAAAKKPKKVKRAYRKRERQEEPARRPSVDLQTPNPQGAVFAVNSNGEIGIDAPGGKTSLAPGDVARLVEFMDTVAPLWKEAA